jgi:hypothetical protein
MPYPLGHVTCVKNMCWSLYYFKIKIFKNKTPHASRKVTAEGAELQEAIQTPAIQNRAKL